MLLSIPVFIRNPASHWRVQPRERKIPIGPFSDQKIVLVLLGRPRTRVFGVAVAVAQRLGVVDRCPDHDALHGRPQTRRVKPLEQAQLGWLCMSAVRRGDAHYTQQLRSDPTSPAL